MEVVGKTYKGFPHPAHEFYARIISGDSPKYRVEYFSTLACQLITSRIVLVEESVGKEISNEEYLSAKLKYIK